jgi:hypothetical protein
MIPLSTHLFFHSFYSQNNRHQKPDNNFFALSYSYISPATALLAAPPVADPAAAATEAATSSSLNHASILSCIFCNYKKIINVPMTDGDVRQHVVL